MSVYANVATAARRIVLGYQHRRFKDLLFQRAIEFVCGIQDRFWFAIAATSKGDPIHADHLIGKIYIYKSKDDWKSKARDVLRDQIYTLNDWRLSIDVSRDKTIDSAFHAAIGRLDNTCDILIEFELSRTGEVYFSKPVFLDTDLEYASIDYAESLRQDFPKWIADQCYFFLRDITHSHQHHTPSSDTILILETRDQAGIDWRRNIVFSLHHYIIRAKRAVNTKALYQSIGVLAYCASFKRICETALGPQVSQIPEFNDNALLQSLQARAAEEEHRIADDGVAATIRVGRRAVWIAILAVLVAVFVMMVQPQIEKGEIRELAEISRAFSRHVPGIASFLGLFFFAIWILTSDWVLRRPTGRDILEASNVRRTGAIWLFAVLALFVMGFSLAFSWRAIRDLFSAVADLSKAVQTP